MTSLVLNEFLRPDSTGDNIGDFKGTVNFTGTWKINDVIVTASAADLNNLTTNITVANKTGGDLAAGTLVYISGYDATLDAPTVTEADADDQEKIATHILPLAILDNASGLADGEITLTTLDTSAYSAIGSLVYLSATAGEFTETAPTAADDVKQIVGVVKVKDASIGEIVFFPLYGFKAVNFINGASPDQVLASKAVVADANGKINLLRLGSAAASASGLLGGVGTSVAPATTSTADGKFLEIRAKTTATSGDNRLGYFRYDIGGAGAAGECIRAFTDLTAAAATARGCHFSLQAGDTGYISGLGVGVDGQLFIKNAAIPAGGTYTVQNAEIYSEGSSSDVSAPTSVSFFRAVNSGDATGAATVDDKAYLFDLTGFTSGAAKLWYDNQGSAPANIEEWLKVKTPAGVRYLPLYDAVV